MRQTVENQQGITRLVRRLTALNGGRLDDDYAAEIGQTLLVECDDLVSVGRVIDMLLESAERLPNPTIVRMTIAKLRPRSERKPWDICPRGCDEGWHHFDREINGVPYSFVSACSCRAGGGR